MGTREVLYAINIFIQKCRDVNVNTYACFIDYRKTFNMVKHNKMIEMLHDAGLALMEKISALSLDCTGTK